MDFKKLFASILLGFVVVLGAGVLLYMGFTCFPGVMMVLLALLIIALATSVIYDDMMERAEKKEEEED